MLFRSYSTSAILISLIARYEAPYPIVEPAFISFICIIGAYNSIADFNRFGDPFSLKPQYRLIPGLIISSRKDLSRKIAAEFAIVFFIPINLLVTFKS